MWEAEELGALVDAVKVFILLVGWLAALSCFGSAGILIMHWFQVKTKISLTSFKFSGSYNFLSK